MKRTLLAISLLAVAALGCAQSSFSTAYAFDPLHKTGPSTVLAYEAKSFTDVFGKGFDLHLKSLVSLQSNAKIGFALTYDRSFKVPFSKEFAPTLSFQVGPWLNYGTGTKTILGGVFVGFGGSF